MLAIPDLHAEPVLAHGVHPDDDGASCAGSCDHRGVGRCFQPRDVVAPTLEAQPLDADRLLDADRNIVKGPKPCAGVELAVEALDPLERRPGEVAGEKRAIVECPAQLAKAEQRRIDAAHVKRGAERGSCPRA
jgi:hypothetical protein